VELEKLRELIQIFEGSDISEIEIEEEGSRILLRKSQPAPVAAAPPVMAPLAAPVDSVTPPAVLNAPGLAGPANHGVSEKESAPEEEDEDFDTIDSPMVGVFYVAPAPGDPAFVRPGDTVETGDTVCIVEAMKLMNEVTAKSPYIIEKVLVENAEPVEYGQPLFAVRPIEQD